MASVASTTHEEEDLNNDTRVENFIDSEVNIMHNQLFAILNVKL